MNILISSASRKVWLIKRFQEALKLEKISGNVIAGDIEPLNPTFHFSDGNLNLLKTTDPSFLSDLISKCTKMGISLIIPTRSGELSLFAKNKGLFSTNGIKVMVSDPDVISMCNDKLEFSNFLLTNGFSGPTTQLYEKSTMDLSKYPYIIKPRVGAGSVGIKKIESIEDLPNSDRDMGDLLIQEYIDGVEYTVDVFTDFDGNMISIVPRERLLVVSGESYKGKTVANNIIINQTKRLVESIGAIGHITVQGIFSSNCFYFIEINPRYGGGANLGIEAGAHTPRFLIQSLLGRPITYDGSFTNNLYMLRYTEDVFTKLR